MKINNINDIEIITVYIDKMFLTKKLRVFLNENSLFTVKKRECLEIKIRNIDYEIFKKLEELEIMKTYSGILEILPKIKK